MTVSPIAFQPKDEKFLSISTTRVAAVVRNVDGHMAPWWLFRSQPSRT